MCVLGRQFKGHGVKLKATEISKKRDTYNRAAGGSVAGGLIRYYCHGRKEGASPFSEVYKEEGGV